MTTENLHIMPLTETDGSILGNLAVDDVVKVIDSQSDLFLDTTKLIKVVEKAKLEDLKPFLELADLNNNSRTDILKLLGGSNGDINRARIIIACLLSNKEKGRQKQGETKLLELPSFAPESLRMGANGDICSNLTVTEKANFDKLFDYSSSQKTFLPPPPTNGQLDVKTTQFIQSMCISPIECSVIEKMNNLKEPIFSIMALPCLNPNPIITDHPDGNAGVNVPTVLFLQRLNHFAECLSTITGREVKVRVISEISAMKTVFNFLTDDQIVGGIEKIREVVEKFRLHRTEVHLLTTAFDQNLRPTESEIGKFLHTFRNSQFKPQVPIPLMLRWTGIINKSKQNQMLHQSGINPAHFEDLIKDMEMQSRTQAERWATLRQANWGEFPLDGIPLSIRPGSSRLKFIPVTNQQNGKTPMLPQHCSVGLKNDGSLFTARRVDFLLNPKKWIEVITEFGSVFKEQ